VAPDLNQARCGRCGRPLLEPANVCPGCVRRWETFQRLATYLRPYRGRLIVQVSASLAITAAGLIPPAITKSIVDRVLLPAAGPADTDSRLHLLGVYVLALLGIRLFTWGAEWVHGSMVAWLGARVTADLRSHLYQRLELLALAFYDRRDVGALTSRITNDSSTLQDFLIRGMPYLLINGLTMFAIFIIMLSISWQLTLWVVLPVPILWIWGVLFWRRMNALFHRWWRANARFSAQLNESLSGVREVKAFGRQEREIARFETLNGDVFRRTLDTARNRVVLLATMGGVTGIGVSILWLLGGRSVLGGRLTVGALVAFYNYVLLFNNPLQWFGQFSDWMTRALTGGDRIFEVLDTVPEAYGDPTAIPTACTPGRIDLRRVTFGYDKAGPVLHDLNLTVMPGEMVGIVGRSGVGKTTMIKLLCRFYDVDGGALEIDGVDIRRLRLEDLRGNIGVVPQEPVLFSGTIAENISYGKPGASLADIVEAAKIANAHRFILAKPDGYDTQIGERGKQLSVGERQRIAIARAVLRDARILILDEATSSVDALSEAQIHKGIHRLARGRTSIVIAHRLSTLTTADRLVVIDHGSVCESGTYEELMARDGIFRDLVRLQEEPLQRAV